MNQLFSVRSIEIRLEPKFLEAVSILSYAKDEAKYIYISPLDKFKKCENLFKFLKEKEDRDYESILEGRMTLHEHSVKCFEKHVVKYNLKIEKLTKKLHKEILKIREFLSYERRLLFIRFYNNNCNEKNKMFWLEHPYEEFKVKNVGDKSIVAYLAEKLIKREYDLIKIEICKPLNN